MSKQGYVSRETLARWKSRLAKICEPMPSREEWSRLQRSQPEADSERKNNEREPCTG